MKCFSKISVFSYVIFLLFIVAGFNCSPKEKDHKLGEYNLSKSSKRYELQKELNEISDLTVAENDRIFALNDEHGIIYELDKMDGSIIKSFYFGSKSLRGDFEGLTLVDNTFYAVTGNGLLYSFEEGANKNVMQAKKYKTGLTSTNDVEGLCYDPYTKKLLLACKNYPGIGLKQSRAIYSFDLKEERLSREPAFVVNLSELKSKFNVYDFSPSAIEYQRDSDSFFILSSHEKSIIQMLRTGEIIDFAHLVSRNHRQPEGLSFLNDGTIIISDEASKKKATLSYFNKLLNQN